MGFLYQRRPQRKSEPLVLNIAPQPGLFAGTKIATRYAWLPVEELSVGDMVLTAQNNEQEILGLETGTLEVSASRAAAGQWPLLLPQNALGNNEPTLVSPGQRILIEDDEASELFGMKSVSVRAQALIGFRGIARARVNDALTHVTLVFNGPETLLTQGELLLELPDISGRQVFTPLDDRQARLLMRNIAENEKNSKGKPASIAWI